MYILNAQQSALKWEWNHSFIHWLFAVNYALKTDSVRTGRTLDKTTHKHEHFDLQIFVYFVLDQELLFCNVVIL